MRKAFMIVYPAAFVAALAISPVLAEEQNRNANQDTNESAEIARGTAGTAKAEWDTRDNTASRPSTHELQAQVAEATEAVNQMKRDPELLQMLEQAEGVFIIPTFGKAAAMIGARGGDGVLLVRNGNEWSGPAFYDFGSLSIGAQAGGAVGPIAMLLMSERAVDAFKEGQTNFSLDANAGVTIADYSRAAQGSLNKSDIVLWSDTEGLFAGASLAVSGIRRDDAAIEAYYNQRATVQQIFAGQVNNPQSDTLREELPSQTAAR